MVNFVVAIDLFVWIHQLSSRNQCRVDLADVTSKYTLNSPQCLSATEKKD